jgi:hypothetical protein
LPLVVLLLVPTLALLHQLQLVLLLVPTLALLHQLQLAHSLAHTLAHPLPLVVVSLVLVLLALALLARLDKPGARPENAQLLLTCAVSVVPSLAVALELEASPLLQLEVS